MKPAPFEYARPKTLSEAVGLLAASKGEARLIAGGQSLGPMLNLRLARPGLLIDIRKLPELTGARTENDGVWLGAATTHAMIEDGLVPDPTQGRMARIAAHIAYRAVRNRGTIGGSLSHADPAADWGTALIALGADCLLTGPQGQRRLPIAEFMLGAFRTALQPSEILTAVWIPTLGERAQWGWYKICRKPGEFATAIGAVLRDPERSVHRSVIGATSGRPILIEDPAAGPEAIDAALSQGTAGLDAIDRHLHATALRRAGSLAA